MIDIEQTIRRGITLAGCARPILGAPYELPSELCRRLAAERAIGGYVGNRPPRKDTGDPHLVGWWVDLGNGIWTVRRSGAREILYLGTEREISGNMLLAARRAGVRTVHAYDAAEDRVHRIAVSKLLRSRAASVLLRRGLGVAKGIAYSSQTYEHAFRALYDDVGDFFRVPPDEFEPRRALLVLGSLGPGGAERQASLTATGLARDGRWNPAIACSYIDGETAGFHRATVERAGIPVAAIPITPPAMDDPVIRNALERAQRFRHLGFQNVAHIVLSYACYIAKARPQLVQTWMDYCNVLAGIAADMVGVPALVMSGRSVAPDNFEIFQPYMRPGYLELLRRRKPVFTNNSRAGAADYARWLDIPPERLTILHNGFEFPQTKPQAQASALKGSLGIPNGSPVVGSILRFSEEKQPQLWIETAAKVLARFPSAYFAAFGGGVMLEQMRDYVGYLGLADRIKLPGLTSDAWTALATMNVFLLTSRMEGLPNVVIEAQAMGVPVVTTGQGGTLETYRDGVTGLTGSVRDADSLAGHVLTLLEDPVRARTMSDEAMRFARGEFAVDSMISRTLRVFDAATGKTGEEQR